MRRAWIGLLIVVLLGVCRISFAAILKAGSYVEFGYVEGLYIEPPMELPMYGYWLPAGATGRQGPLLIEHSWGMVVKITAVEDAYVKPGTVVWEDSGMLNGLVVPWWSTIVSSWRSNYDPTQFRFRLYLRRPDGSEQLTWELLAADEASSQHPETLSGSLVRPDTSLVFRLEAIPEPAGLTCLTTAFLSSLGLLACRRMNGTK